ncbi:MAG: Gfo/Idh/MocA family oxidoreductase [Anaerolineae bacterium]|jgi:predicted dehydrogenase
MMLRVGIIGAGQVGKRQAVGFAAAAGAEVTGVADIALERATALTERFGGTAVTDWRQLMDFDLDILAVCLPHNNHVGPAQAAAECGVHVLMEKPIATNLEDGQRIVDLCDQAGVKLTISFVHRFRDECQFARQWLDEGRIGSPQIVRGVMTAPRKPELPPWVTNKEAAGGGVMMYSAIHEVDRLRWLVGSDVVSVAGQIRRWDPNSEVEDGAVALLTFANSTAASLTANAPSYWAQPALWETEVWGSEGMLRIGRGGVEISSNRLQTRLETQTPASRLGEHYNFVRQAEAFVSAINEDTEPPVSARDGLESLRVVMALYESAETGEIVHL